MGYPESNDDMVRHLVEKHDLRHVAKHSGDPTGPTRLALMEEHLRAHERDRKAGIGHFHEDGEDA